jgi:DNA-binding NarL/FixJ family response regulator
LLDLNIKGVNSLEWLERIRLWQPKLKVIAFSSYNTTAIVRKALQAGVDGYLLKDVSATELEEALQAVVSGKRFVCERVNGRGDTSRSGSNTFFEDEFVLEARLTGREREVMLAIVEGLDSKSIAKRLYISLHTVQSHRKRLFKKLGVHSAAELIRFVHRKPED